MEAKNLTEGERKYMDDTVGDHDRLNFYAWVDKKRDKKVEKRLLVVTDHRMLSIKRKVTGNKTVRRNGHFYDMISLDCTSMEKVKVTFPDFVFEFEGNLAFQAVNAINNAVNVLYHDFPDTARPQINLCEEMEDKLRVLSKAPQKSLGGHLLEHYEARCSFLKTAPNMELQQFLKKFCEGDAPHLQLSECPGIRLKGSKELDLKPLFMALRHNTFVESILLEGVPKKDLMTLLADTMATNSTIHTIHLVGTELGDNGWAEFGAALKSNSGAKLSDIDFSKNKMANKSASALSLGLKAQATGVKSLKFGTCELKSKGLSAIIDSISTNKAHWTTLEELDVSGNSWDDSVSRLLTSTLEKMRAVPLHTLRIQDCGVNVFSVMHAIEIVKKTLRLLDLSGNRINSSSLHALCSVLNSCQILQELKVAGCKLTEASVESILNAVGSNPAASNIAFRLDVSRNELGAKKAKGTAALVRGLKAATPLKEICIRDSKFRLIDLFAVLKAVKESPNLTRLSIGTVKASYNAKLMNVIVDTVKTHSVEYLDLSGTADGKLFYGKTMLPLFEAVPALKNMKELDIRHNKIGPTQFARLCESMKRNTSIMVLKIDGNNLTHESWNLLNEMLNMNTVVAAVDTPFSDIAAAVASSKDKEGTNSLLMDLWTQIQERLERRRTGQAFMSYRASLSRSEQLSIKNMTRNTLYIPVEDEDDVIVSPRADGTAGEETVASDDSSAEPTGEENYAKSGDAPKETEEEEEQKQEGSDEPEAEEEEGTAEEEEEKPRQQPAFSPCGGMRVMPAQPVTARVPSRESMALNRSASQKEVTRGSRPGIARANSDEDLKSRARGQTSQSKVTTAPRRKLQRPNLQPPGSLPSPGGGRGRGVTPSPGRGRGAAPSPARGGRGAAPSPSTRGAPPGGGAPRGGGRAAAPARGRGGPAGSSPAGRGSGGGRGGASAAAGGGGKGARKPAGQFGTVYGSMPDLDDLMDDEPVATESQAAPAQARTLEPAPQKVPAPAPQKKAPVPEPATRGQAPAPQQKQQSTLARPGPSAGKAKTSAQFGTVYGEMPDLDDLMAEFCDDSGAGPAAPPEQKTVVAAKQPSPGRPSSPAYQMRSREVPQRKSTSNFGTVYGSMPDIYDDDEEDQPEEAAPAAAEPAANPFLSQGPIFVGAAARGRGRAAAHHRQQQPQQQQQTGRPQQARGRGGPPQGGRGNAGRGQAGRGRGQARPQQRLQQQPPPQQQQQQQQQEPQGERDTVYGIMPL